MLYHPLYLYGRNKIAILQTFILLILSLTTLSGANHLLLLSLLALRANVEIIRRRHSNSCVNLTNMFFFILLMMSIKHFIVWQALLAPVLYLDAVIFFACAYALLIQQSRHGDFNVDAGIIAIGASACLFLARHVLLTGLTSEQTIAAVNALLTLTTSVLLVLILYFDHLTLLMPHNNRYSAAHYLAEQSKWLLVLYTLFKITAEALDIYSVYQQVFGFAAVLLLLFTVLTVLPVKARLGSKGRNFQGLLLCLPLCLLPIFLDCCFSRQQGDTGNITEFFYQLCPLLLLSLSYIYALMTGNKAPGLEPQKA
ncbi:hypothetical protein [Thalassomonas haliotis]|uniref:Uncharacterized protein n=1 Tax=Thalassomonas haliotis TaxID=485448 RepID=A0ABY7VIV1_9GAMM|nr:hypothetical protein [Thalassomonas haliotis]WDE12895.1 hypothetical protein H3N35_05370 [Thalassomonas haliotis]